MRSVLLGELPPPQPRSCFGRNELITEIVGFAENLEPIALIGAGGIGKTHIALAVLHHDRIKDRFGDNRRFIRCDQFPASGVHFLARLSQAIGAGIKDPEDLTALRPFLSSKEMILFLDSAEAILDPQGTDSGEIYSLVEELSHFENICLGITSRVSIIPLQCKRPTIPTLSMESACDIFYAIYNNGGQSDTISDLVKRLDFHALSIALLATMASHNGWDYDRLAKEWDTRQVGVLRTDHNESLAAAIELSLASPVFRQLTPPSKSHKSIASSTFSKLITFLSLRQLPPSARELLEVVAFFPQGLNEDNLDWLLPTTPDRRDILDKSCVLSLTQRTNGFITMLAPIRDYLRPLDSKPSPLYATKDLYLTRLSVSLDPGTPAFEKARWITSEDINVEHLLDVFTSIDRNAHDAWRACGHFMEHLRWHKPRRTVLGSKIEHLPDGNRFKAGCLFELALLFGSVGNDAEEKRLLTHTLSLWRGRWNIIQVSRTLWYLSDVNLRLGLYREGIEQAEKVLKISKRFWYTPGQVNSLNQLTWLYLGDGQLDAAANAASRVIDLSGKGQEYSLCQTRRALGHICRRKGEKEEAIEHFGAALRTASHFNWQDELFGIHRDLAQLFLAEDKLDDANTHIGQAKSHAVDNAYNLAHGAELQARIWYRQHRLEDARFEALGALEIYEKLGVARKAEVCRKLLQEIEQTVERQAVSDKSDCGGELSRYNVAPDPC